MLDSATATVEADNASFPEVEADDSSPSASIQVQRVAPAALEAVWPRVQRMLRESVRWSPYTRKLQTINDVRARVFAGDYTLWLIFDDTEIAAAVVTRLTDEAQCRVLDVLYGAGERLLEWLEPLYETLDDEATETDCRFIRVEGRPGWGKALEAVGAVEVCRTYMVEV